MADPEELALIRTCFRGPTSDDLRAAFVIDGRDYDDPDTVRADYIEASREIDRRGIIAEFETRPIKPSAPRPDLPTWQEYRDRVLSAERDESE